MPWGQRTKHICGRFWYCCICGSSICCVFVWIWLQFCSCVGCNVCASQSPLTSRGRVRGLTHQTTGYTSLVHGWQTRSLGWWGWWVQVRPCGGGCCVTTAVPRLRKSPMEEWMAHLIQLMRWSSPVCHCCCPGGGCSGCPTNHHAAVPFHLVKYSASPSCTASRVRMRGSDRSRQRVIKTSLMHGCDA